MNIRKHSRKDLKIIRGSKETLVTVTIHLTQFIIIKLHTTNPWPQPLLHTIPSDILSLQITTLERYPPLVLQLGESRDRHALIPGEFDRV